MVLAEKNHPIPSLPKNDHCSPLTTTTINQWSTPDSGCLKGQGLSSPGERSTIWQLSEKSESSFPGAGWDSGDHSRWPLANWKGVKREVAAGPTCLRGKWTSQIYMSLSRLSGQTHTTDLDTYLWKRRKKSPFSSESWVWGWVRPGAGGSEAREVEVESEEVVDCGAVPWSPTHPPGQSP